MRIGRLTTSVVLQILADLLVIGWAGAEEARSASDAPFAAFSESLTTVPQAPLATHGLVYVPAFSSVHMGGGRTRLDLAVTLSIHNTSESDSLVLDRIDYFNTSGNLVQRYVEQPIALRPFGTVEVFIPADDVRGGTGANFLVSWAAVQHISEPAVQAVMVGNVGTAGYSFTSSGKPIR